ncbi:snRNA-activating protein complex subunit 4 isoform X2 [Sorex araneus]|uniref:snRNA-activating protein complex subunit 4 isoform X2 n=1 Tax=Sorex araneus TaxID=42254 RepID=UPI0024337A9A|nr:snRNA-activating protein complex subunit 4 isoform X2 [Sorex araneus]
MDAAAEREQIAREIRELERILDPGATGLGVDVSDSSLGSDSDADAPPSEDSDAAEPPSSEEERWGGAQKALAEDPETCLQLNLVYQEVVREKLAELSLLLAQNREQQEEITWGLAGSKGPRVKDGRSLPPNMYIGHFLKPYFKDRVTGVGPPANEDTRDKSAQGIKGFEQLLVTKWKGWEKALLRKAVVSDRLQRLLQPKLLKLEYLQQKQSRAGSEAEKLALEQQAREAEREVQEINRLPEDVLLGHRLDSHDWEKISNVSFEGARSAEEIRKFWQNCEHPSINKQDWSRPEVDQLMAIAARHGFLEWQKVAEELGTHRSAFQCLQKYQQYNKALKRREWTEEEDRMLTQLVQEMRVGSHVPYRRIVYYMEGRDSMQLIYRWTKSLDPRLRKGCWAPEEDAKLLQAVAKYGEQDWFKIREEVPGRSDAQCRDRYLRRLHFSLKKGRWDCREEGKLLELVGKHGVGNWAKIASELPQRTGSQCLSKWKIMVRKQGRRRRRPRCRVRWSSSSDSSVDGSVDSSVDGSCEDSEPEEAPQAGAGGPAQPSAQHPVPDLALWVPARTGITGRGSGGLGARLGCASSPAPGAPPGPTDASREEPADEKGQCRRKVPRETVLRVLESNTAARRRMLKQKLSGPARPCVPQQWPRALRRGRALHQRLLHRQLLMAVSPWVGDITLPPTPRRQALRTQADSVREQLQDTRLPSTPVFTLLIQLFQIDAAGCLEVVRERKAPALTQVPPSAQDSPGGCSPQVPAREATRSSRSKGAGAPQAAAPTPAAPSGPRPKPKTVSELLREKRLREARARRAAQGPSLAATPLLLTLATPSTVGPGHTESPCLPQTSGLPAWAPSQLPPGSPGQSQAPAACRKQGLPGPPPFLPATPSPAQPPGQALGMPEARPHAVTGVPLPVTWVLTAQGLLPVPTVLGLPGLAATSDPKGLLLAQLPPSSSASAPSCPQPPPGSTEPGPELPARTDATPSPAEQGQDKTRAGEAPAGLRPSPAASPRTAEHLGCGLPPPGRTPAGSQGPQDLEKPPQPGPEKGALELGLLSLEAEAAVREWLAGRRGVCASPLGRLLPYQPPALCGLRALAGLLLHKAALEHRAASLLPSGALPTALAEVRAQLRCNPAYQLLRARFLAAFTLPALLATLPPRGIPTTLSGADPETEDEDCDELGELVPPSSLSPGTTTAGEGALDAAPGTLEASDDGDEQRTRRSRHARKRRRLV